VFLDGRFERGILRPLRQPTRWTFRREKILNTGMFVCDFACVVAFGDPSPSVWAVGHGVRWREVAWHGLT
jgi:hypothetical protein